MRFLLALAISAVSLLAADVSGKWSGSFDVTVDGDGPKTETAVLLLKQDGSKITGTAGPAEDKQFQIQNASLEGNTLKLEVLNDENGENSVIYVTLALDGDKLTGEATAEREGHKMSAKLVLTRQKA